MRSTRGLLSDSEPLSFNGIRTVIESFAMHEDWSVLPVYILNRLDGGCGRKSTECTVVKNIVFQFPVTIWFCATDGIDLNPLRTGGRKSTERTCFKFPVTI
jgi:hypothetical protein